MQGHLFLTKCESGCSVGGHDVECAGHCYPKIADVQTNNTHHHKTEMDEYQMTAVFLQISNSSAILIFSARTLSFFFTSMPAWQLMFSTILGQVLVNIALLIPHNGLVKPMEPTDMGYVWAYDICWLLILDLVKMSANWIWDQYKDPNIDSNPAIQ